MSNFRMRYCPIVGCKNYRGCSDVGIRFFTMSKAKGPLMEKWVKSIRTYMPDFPDISRFRICQLHFDPDDINISKSQHRLRLGAIPTRFPFEATKMKQEIVPGVPLSLKKIKIIRTPNGTIQRPPNESIQRPPNEYIKRPQLVQDPLKICSKCEDHKVEIQVMQKKMRAIQEQMKEQQFEITALHNRTKYLKQFEPNTVQKTEKCTVCELKLTTEELYLHVCKQFDDKKSDTIRCEFCLKPYNATIKLVNHLHICHIQNPDKTFYHCKKCPKVFDMAQLMDIHEKMHTEEKPEIICEKCSQEFFTQHEYDDHMLMQHQALANLLKEHSSEKKSLKVGRQPTRNLQKITFECYMCQKGPFQSFRNVKLHIKEHGIPPISKCSVCWTMMYTSQLEGHLCKNVVQADDDDVDRSIDCEYCPEKFQSIIKLFQHIDDKHAKVKILYRCIKCPNIYPVKGLLEHHTAVHAKEIFKCNKCTRNRSFETLKALNLHIKRHETQEVHLCDECGSALKSKRNLKIHKLSHSQPQLKCNLCPRKFKVSAHLRKHQNFHSKQMFSCQFCDFKCTSSDQMGHHIKRHTNPKEKRFECTQCTFKATEQGRVIQHMSTVHTTLRQFHCDFENCSRSYKHKGDLNKHLRTHLGDDMYACSQCPKRFRLQLDLQKHASEHYIEESTMDTEA